MVHAEHALQEQLQMLNKEIAFQIPQLHAQTGNVVKISTNNVLVINVNKVTD